MKKLIACLLALSLLSSVAACGSGAATGSTPGDASFASEAPEDGSLQQGMSPDAADSTLEQTEDTVTMRYFLDLKDGSIMAACIDDHGTETLGADYIKVYVDNAEIVDADGNPIAFSDIVRGSTLQVTFPGIVTMSIPAQISATKILVTDEDPSGIPAEDEIPDLFGTGKWWEPEVVNQAPDMYVQYESTYGLTSQIIPYHTGTWSYGDDSAREGGMTNASLDGQKPQNWVYDEYNTIQRAGFDTVKLTFAPAPEEMTVTAYDRADPEDTGTQIPVEADGSIALLDGDGDVVYTVSGTWNSEAYQGWAVYGFLVTAAE